MINFDQKQAMALWNEINLLTIQVSKLKENFARLINGDTIDTDHDDRSQHRVRPPVMKKKR
jgi:hypothetical protein